MINVRDLRVDYDNFCAVSDLSLSVKAGEVCGLIGPNGAGKTTTMRAMLGLVEPTYGEIEMAGVDMRDRPRDACRFVGFMPDNPPMYDDLKCWEFLDLFAASYGIPKPDRRRVVAEHLELVGLTDKADEMVKVLSRGMRQRLMLAKTLIPDPKILILDEPASGIDPQGRIDLKNILKDLAGRGKAVLVSSHILTEMQEFCGSVAIMEKGRMVVSGSIEAVNRQVLGAAEIVVEVLSSPETFLRIVAEEPDAANVERRDGIYAFRYAGTSEQAADLLAKLIGAGVRISAFAPRKEGLEDLFLKVGAKELS
ncbi:MAG: ABC-type multidrug transport system, ATPase component [Planctomycetota bacterium]|nr:ABC-type multidrug transport system, ATPase component [Planctomycetota bacterium]